MNQNYDVYTGRPLRPMVFHPKYGYVEPEKLPVKKIRSELNILSSTTLCMLAASFVLSLGVGLFFGLGGIALDPVAYPESGGIPTTVYFAMQMLMLPLSTGLPFLICMLIRKQKFSELVPSGKFGFGFSCLLVLAGSGLCLAFNFPALLLGDLISSAGLEPGLSETPPAKDLFSGICYFMGVAVMAPVFEEFAFRGVILGSLKKYGRFFALVVSSLIFGLMHMSATSVLFATLAGLVMGYVYLLTDNIWVNVAIHFVNNAVAVILDIASHNVSELVYGILNLLLFYLPMFLAVVAIVLLLIMKKLRLPKLENTEKFSAGSKFAAVFTSVGFLSFLVIMAAFVVMGLFGVM